MTMDLNISYEVQKFFETLINLENKYRLVYQEWCFKHDRYKDRPPSTEVEKEETFMKLWEAQKDVAYQKCWLLKKIQDEGLPMFETLEQLRTQSKTSTPLGFPLTGKTNKGGHLAGD